MTNKEIEKYLTKKNRWLIPYLNDHPAMARIRLNDLVDTVGELFKKVKNEKS